MTYAEAIDAGAIVETGVDFESGLVIYTNDEVPEDAGIGTVPDSPRAVDNDELLEGAFKLAIGGPRSPEVLMISVVSNGSSEIGQRACEVESTDSDPLQIIVVAVTRQRIAFTRDLTTSSRTSRPLSPTF